MWVWDHYPSSSHFVNGPLCHPFTAIMWSTSLPGGKRIHFMYMYITCPLCVHTSINIFPSLFACWKCAMSSHIVCVRVHTVRRVINAHKRRIFNWFEMRGLKKQIERLTSFHFNSFLFVSLCVFFSLLILIRILSIFGFCARQIASNGFTHLFCFFVSVGALFLWHFGGFFSSRVFGKHQPPNRLKFAEILNFFVFS